jgi:hypothetical protein
VDFFGHERCVARRLRPGAVLGLLVPIALLVTACGSSTQPRGSASAKQITKARAVAYADELNLREADILGWEREASGGPAKVVPALLAESKCEGRNPYLPLVVLFSPIYGQRGTGNMRSQVAVAPTAALAESDARAGLSARAFRCFAKAVAPATVSLAGKPFDRGPGTLTRLASPLPGVPDSYEWRITWTRSFRLGPQYDIKSYEDLLGFVAGPAEIDLAVRSVDRPLPEATELQALRGIYNRAKADGL